MPFLCHFGRAVTLTDADPYSEIARHLKMHRGKEESVLRTLSYFDGVLFAARGSAPALFSVALMDQVCPPSTVFAAHNAYRGEKEIEVYRTRGRSHVPGGRSTPLGTEGAGERSLSVAGVRPRGVDHGQSVDSTYTVRRGTSMPP